VKRGTAELISARGRRARPHQYPGGLVQLRKRQQTGLFVGVYNAEQAGLDTSGGLWVTVCESHAQLINHETLRLALDHAADPMGWCSICNEAETLI
jgi:hypothetical protein